MKIAVQIQSILELVPPEIDDLLKTLSYRVKLSEEDSHDIRLILEEAISNAISHGNDFDTGLKVDIALTVDNNLMTISIKDEGKGFKHQDVPDPVKNESLMKSSGRGIYLIKKIADSVQFNDQGNEITITKRIQNPIK